MKFQKGICPNPKGRPRAKTFDDVLLREIKRGKRSKQLAEALIELGISKGPGSVQALKLIVERLGGRARQMPEPPQPPQQEVLTPEQVNSRLADLLARPEVKERLLSLLETKGGTQ